MTLKITLRGQPYQVHVLHYRPEIPMRVTGWGYGDADPPEEEEFEWEIEGFPWTPLPKEITAIQNQIRRHHAELDADL
jgi:hypothetical protein